MSATFHLASALIEIVFESKPSPSVATCGREFFRSAYASLLDDEDLCFSVGLVAHELMENIIKYSAEGVRSISVGIDRGDSGRRVWVKSVNRVAAEEVQALASALEAIRNTDAPDALYDRMISESANREGSGLGLIRIRAEANMDVDYQVDGTTVTICASRAIPGIPTEQEQPTERGCRSSSDGGF